MKMTIMLYDIQAATKIMACVTLLLSVMIGSSNGTLNILIWLVLHRISLFCGNPFEMNLLLNLLICKDIFLVALFRTSCSE